MTHTAVYLADAVYYSRAASLTGFNSFLNPHIIIYKSNVLLLYTEMIEKAVAEIPQIYPAIIFRKNGVIPVRDISLKNVI